ncbi:hypothetical protein B0H11DRAFT_1701472 [Mycena galericulata]|nr:hypothetical protein B0H11DRAFT_1701472 [Mycena galericulata]
MFGSDRDSETELRSPAKRQRTAGGPCHNPVLVHSKIWMPYGDIILKAESTLFRVNKDILAKHSPVFEGMLLFPQPQNEDTIDGCAIVELSDTAKDIELLLSALYDPFHQKPKQPFKVVASMLRMGRKYEFTEFKKDATLRLHYEFPCSLKMWDARIAKKKLDKIEVEAGIYLDLLNLTYENGIYTSIPTLAFKCLEGHFLEELFTGITRIDGSRAILPDSIKSMLALALEKLQREQYDHLEWMRDNFANPDKGFCGICRGFELDTRRSHPMYIIPQEHHVTCTILPWEKVGDGHWMNRLCEACEADTKSEWDIRRRETWNKLPTFFGLPGWKDLKDLN